MIDFADILPMLTQLIEETVNATVAGQAGDSLNNNIKSVLASIDCVPEHLLYTDLSSTSCLELHKIMTKSDICISVIVWTIAEELINQTPVLHSACQYAHSCSVGHVSGSRLCLRSYVCGSRFHGWLPLSLSRRI